MSARSKVKKIGRSEKPARHVRLYHWLLETAAWRSLDATDRALYLELLRRYAGPNTNNGRIPYSVREAAHSLHIGKSTAAQSFLRLQERGFIVPVQKGGFLCKVRHSTEWLLTEFPSDTDVPELGIKTSDLARKDFTRWHPQKQKPVLLSDRTVAVDGQHGTSEQTVALKRVV